MRTMTCLLVLFAAACQDGSPSVGSSKDQGLTVFSDNRKDGLVGMYAEGDRMVFFETVTQPITDDLIAHYYEHEIPLTRPTFVLRWTDEEGRAISQDGDWDDTDDIGDPAKWEDSLDLTRKAAAVLADASLAPEVADEQARLVRVARTIPEASARVLQATPEELQQIQDRQIAYGYLGYSWKSYYYVRKPSGVNFHQGSSWDNWYWYSGAWRYYNQKVRNNDVDSPDYECGGAWSYVQDYKSYASADSSIHIGGYSRCTGTYAVCTLPFTQSYNCRSEALRTQVWVLGNVRCSWSAGMCDTAQGVPWGAYCGIRTTCASRSTC
jgi:hypothetical protein